MTDRFALTSRHPSWYASVPEEIPADLSFHEFLRASRSFTGLNLRLGFELFSCRFFYYHTGGTRFSFYEPILTVGGVFDVLDATDAAGAIEPLLLTDHSRPVCGLTFHIFSGAFDAADGVIDPP